MSETNESGAAGMNSNCISALIQRGVLRLAEAAEPQHKKWAAFFVEV
jgi:hypothetical protein